MGEIDLDYSGDEPNALFRSSRRQNLHADPEPRGRRLLAGRGLPFHNIYGSA
jgi:hypothetical protein